MSTIDFAARRDRLRAAVTDAGVDAVLVTALPNIHYLTGFNGSNAVLLMHVTDPAKDRLGTDGRYVDQAGEQAPDLALIVDRATVGAVSKVAPDLGIARLGIESSMTLAGKAGVEQAAPGLALVVLDGEVERLRAHKDAVEVEALERACTITSQAIEALFTEVRVGMTEIALARRLEQLFGELGAEDRAFDTIVCGGPASAIPHHKPTDRALRAGDFLLVDAGARVDGYHADMTRTVVVGAEPQDWQREIHGVVDASAAAGRAALVAGKDPREVYAASYDVIAEAGYAERFTHGLGHGIGLFIHEVPFLSAISTDTIPGFSVLTIEPGIYLPGRGGVRIEDTLVVDSQGARALTTGPRELRVIG